MWSNQVRPNIERPTREALAASAEIDELRRLITNKDPDMPEPDWWKLAAIIYHETEGSDEGYALFDEWSSAGSKYAGPEDTAKKWDEIGRRPPVENPATAGSLRREDVGTLDELGDAPLAHVDDDMLGKVEAAEHAARIASVKWQKLGEYKLRPLPEMLIKKVLPRKPLGAAYASRK